MHRGPRGGKVEKSKDFKKAIKNLINYLKPWHVMLAISLTLAMISAVLSLVAPNKLSDVTDEITKGLAPKLTEERIKNIMANPDISSEDKEKFSIILEDAKKIDKNDSKAQQEFLVKIDELPKSIYNEIKPEMNFERIKKITIFLAIVYIISALFSYIQSIIMANVSNGFARNLRSNISKKINLLPLSYFDNHETGDILSRVTNDVDTMSQSMNQSLASLVTNLTLFIGSIIMMFYTNWIMALTAIIASIFGFGFMASILSKSQKYFTQKQEELGK